VRELHLLPEHHLHHARPVAQVDEDDTPVVAPAGHPAGERHRRAGVRGAQASGVMGTDHGYVSFVNGCLAILSGLVPISVISPPHGAKHRPVTLELIDVTR
jgi:hypothetical protein